MNEQVKTYHIVTFGCQMNEWDSETLAGMLEDAGYIGAEDKTSADVVVFNTCSIRDNADKRFFGVLGQWKKRKLSRPDMTVVVCGCMMQQAHIVDAIHRKYSWVDLILGTHNIHRFPQLLDDVQSRSEHLSEIWDDAGAVVEELPACRKYPFKAYVNIMYGSNNFCTYCIGPYTRGRERSRRPGDILLEIREAAAQGTK